MPDMKWTSAQRRAIEQTGSSLLVSSAAGSGKTATLTERIIRSLTDRGGDISRMLVVTFTRAAVSELRTRIARALEEAAMTAPALRRQLYLLEDAKICTIHSFCLDLLRPNFDRAGLPARFRTLEEAEVKILRRRVMDELVTDCYDRAWEEIAPEVGVSFPEFADCFLSGRDENGLIELFVGLYEALTAEPDGNVFWDSSAGSLERAAQGEFFTSDNPYGQVVLRECEGMLMHFYGIFTRAREQFAPESVQGKAMLPALIEDLAFIDRARIALGKGYSAARAVFSEYAAMRLGALRGENKTVQTEDYRAARDDFKKELERMRSAFFASSPEGLAGDCAASARYLRAAGALLREFDRRYAAAKRRADAIDYADMEHLTLGLLYDADGAPSELAREAAAHYDQIFIDEYQDVNAVQDRIFSAVARPDNRFMVGDIKQSIYGFRGAQPDLFAGYRRAWSEPGAPGRVIFMSENFRSDPSVIDFTNAVFDALWQAAGQSIDYRPDDRLICGRSVDVPPRHVTLLLSETGLPAGKNEDGEDAPPPPGEAERVASEIRHLLDGETKNDGTPIRPGDIAIIVRSAKNFLPLFEQALARAGVPVQSRGDDAFFENPEVLLMLCLLSVIENPRQDVYLLGLLLSPLCGFTLEELVRVRRGSEKELSLIEALQNYTARESFAKGEKFLADLANYRRFAKGAPCDRLIWQLYRECGILSVLGASAGGKPGAADRRRNLLALYEYARGFEAHGFRGLYSFLRYLRSLIDAGTPLPSPAAPGGDAVQLLTVHGSKGLEFPVCFVCGCGRKYNELEKHGSLLFDRALGAAMKLRIPGHVARAGTALRAAVAAHLTERGREEELRVLYVALTRARERLYLSASISDAERALCAAQQTGRSLDRYAVLRQNRYVDLVLAALAASPDGVCDISLADRPQQNVEIPPSPPVPEQTQAPIVSPPDPDEVGRLAALLEERLAYRYPYEQLSRLPAKLSVSRLYPGVLDEQDEGSDALLYARDEVRARAALTLAASPAFLGGDTGRTAADAGTATHVFLQFCDFDALALAGGESERDRLVAAGFLGADMAAAVRMDEVARFTRSALFGELRGARHLWREQRFNLRLPAARFTREPERREALAEERLLVQGVIDCFFLTQGDELVLVDYKTDRLTPEQCADPARATELMRRRHGEQLEYYALALADIMGRRPDRVLVYSLALGEALAL